VVNFTPWLFYPQRKDPSTHYIEDWVGPKANLDVLNKRKILPLLGFKSWVVQPIA
jgi:hypothetical protein